MIGPIGDENAPYGSPERSHYEESLEVLKKVVEPACDEFHITPVRSDRMHRPGEIPEQVFVALRDYDLVVADLSDANPNVMYELALRHAVGKCAVLLSEWKRLPFDVQWLRTIPFVRSEMGLIDARKKLVEALRAAIEVGCDRVTATRIIRDEPAQLAGAPRPTATGPTPQPEEEEPGFLDILAEMEEAMPRLNSTIEEIAGVLGQLGELADHGTAELHELDAAGAPGVGPRLPILARFAGALGSPADRLESLSSRYAWTSAESTAGCRICSTGLRQSRSLSARLRSSPGPLSGSATRRLRAWRRPTRSQTRFRHWAQHPSSCESRLAGSPMRCGPFASSPPRSGPGRTEPHISFASARSPG